MPLIHINFKQWLLFVEMLSDSIAPLWRMFRINEKYRVSNVPLVFILSIILVGQASLGVSPEGKIEYFTASGILSDLGFGIEVQQVYLRLFICFFIIILIIFTFMIDLKDSLSKEEFCRFSYFDEKNSYSAHVWWSISLLLFGYMIRLWIFKIAVLSGLVSAHFISTVKCGVTILYPSDNIGFDSSFVQIAFVAIQDPLGIIDVASGCGFFPSGFVMIGNASRVLVITFLIGAFSILVSRISVTLSRK